VYQAPAADAESGAPNASTVTMKRPSSVFLVRYDVDLEWVAGSVATSLIGCGLKIKKFDASLIALWGNGYDLNVCGGLIGGPHPKLISSLG
jgi:hypothetical protein